MNVYKKKNSNTNKKKKSILKANNVTKMTKKKNYREVTNKMEKRTEVTQCFLQP